MLEYLFFYEYEFLEKVKLDHLLSHNLLFGILVWFAQESISPSKAGKLDIQCVIGGASEDT